VEEMEQSKNVLPPSAADRKTSYLIRDHTTDLTESQKSLALLCRIHPGGGSRGLETTKEQGLDNAIKHVASIALDFSTTNPLHGTAALPRGRSTLYLLHRRVVAPQIRCGRCGEKSCPCRESKSDRSARSLSIHRLGYPCC
jgi:ArsR family metal-binding transcriptional regulator